MRKTIRQNTERKELLKSELPVYKGEKIEPEKKKQLATVGICLDTDKRKSNNIDFRLQRF